MAGETMKRDDKLAAAKAYLGPRWLLPPSNQIKRQPKPQKVERIPESVRK